MQPIFYVLAIMGCGDDTSGCAEARVEPVRFATVQQCRAAAPDLLSRHTDLEFPVISAACRANGPQLVSEGKAAPQG